MTILEMWEARPCFSCEKTGFCRHREPEVEEALIEHYQRPRVVVDKKPAVVQMRLKLQPKSYCSVPCKDMSRVQGEGAEVPPEPPAAILAAMRLHRLRCHGSAASLAPLAWLECATCEELEADYAESLHYHHQISEEMASKRAEEMRMRHA